MTRHKYVRMARSRKNGIVLFSNTFPMICAEAHVNSSGKIISNITNVSVSKDEFINSFGILDKKKLFSIKGAIVFDILLVIASILLKNIWLFLATAYFVFFVSFRLYTFMKLASFMKSQNGTKYSVAKFHAAEHMVINAYTNLQRIPSFDEVERESRFSEHCGSMKYIKDITYKLFFCILLACGGFHFFNYLLLLSFFGILLIRDKKNHWIKIFQVFITSTPSDTEIKVAIEAIKKFEQMESSFNDSDSFVLLHVV